eukprot:gnl/Ergobibamus_cyprinoides/249.p1 GENE.gnl/Ergobibamus_cyprinoides/249~~gnl/Ergobibamus_cyprinoides/249.p1  ORF type:complete len:407 (+),score=154.52 gnl/Ergobibamus_cyprinoides/249:79-1221(+)
MSALAALPKKSQFVTKDAEVQLAHDRWIAFAENNLLPASPKAILNPSAPLLETLRELQEYLIPRVTLSPIGCPLSLADVVIYACLRPHLQERLNATQLPVVCAIIRYYRYVDSLLAGNGHLAAAGLTTPISLPALPPTVFTHFHNPKAAAAAKKAGQKAPKTAPKVEVPAVPAVPAVPQAEKKEKPVKAEKKEKKEKKDKAPAPTDAVTISHALILVGHVRSVAHHPTSDHLYVEEIYCGEKNADGSERLRTICSGLREHVAQSELEDSLVVVAANLKPMKLKGVMSEGMVMAASKGKGTETEVIELLRPAEGSKPGDKISCADFPATPMEELKPKKKHWDQVAPHFTVDAEGKALWQGKALTTAAGAAFAPTVRDGIIS